MEIKFNCPNPACNQRIAVDEALAGGALRCPACATTLKVPLWENLPSMTPLPGEIQFNCRNPQCLKPIKVDPLQAGRWMKCPQCGNIVQVPGTRIESVSDPVLVEALPVEAEAIVPVVVEINPNAMEDETLSSLWNLVKGWGLGTAILGLLIGILSWHTRAALPKNMNAIMDEIYFHGEILMAPIINHAGTELVYVRTVEQGMGVFLVNLDTLERKQIALVEAADADRAGAVKLFGWSPDDHYLAFSALQKGKNRNITLCDGKTGAVINTIESPGSVETGSWLGANSLAMIDNNHLLFLLNLEADGSLGQYGRNGFVKLLQLDKTATDLVPDSAHSTIAYVDQGNVWSFNFLTTNQAVQLTHLTDAVISSLDYSGDTYRYLFTATTAGSPNPILYQYDLRAPQAPLTRLTNDNFAFKGQWIQDGTGTAYVGTEGNRYYIGIKSKDTTLSTNLFTAPKLNTKTGVLNRQLFAEGREVVRTFSVNPKNDKIYAVASVNYEPLAIWEYNIAGKALRKVVPEKEHLATSQFIAPVQASIINQDGKMIDYYYLPPAGLTRNKKYPVVVDTFSDWGYQPNSQFLANAGIFFVVPDRYGIGFPNSSSAPADILAVYNDMLKNPNVDSKRIYLFAESLGNGPVSYLLTEHPELWRGAIMSEAATFPQFMPDIKQYHASILFSFSESENFQNQQFAEGYAKEACAHLMRTRIDYWRGGQVMFDVGTIEKKYKAIATFILTDY